MRKILIIITLLVCLPAIAFIGGGGGGGIASWAQNAFHADNADNATATNAYMQGVFHGAFYGGGSLDSITDPTFTQRINIVDGELDDSFGNFALSWENKTASGVWYFDSLVIGATFLGSGRTYFDSAGSFQLCGGAFSGDASGNIRFISLTNFGNSFSVDGSGNVIGTIFRGSGAQLTGITSAQVGADTNGAAIAAALAATNNLGTAAFMPASTWQFTNAYLTALATKQNFLFALQTNVVSTNLAYGACPMRVTLTNNGYYVINYAAHVVGFGVGDYPSMLVVCTNTASAGVVFDSFVFFGGWNNSGTEYWDSSADATGLGVFPLNTVGSGQSRIAAVYNNSISQYNGLNGRIALSVTSAPVTLFWWFVDQGKNADTNTVLSGSYISVEQK